MIEYDYILERDEGDRKKEFKPDKIKPPLANIVYIEGPNSSGKSALLHILALSMHGLKNEKIHPSLLRKMESFIKDDYQRLVFEVNLTNKDGSLKLTSKKKAFEMNEIEVREIKNGNERIISPDLFNKEYELIYDIPDNPTERIKQLAGEIKDIQKEYGYKASLISSHILGLIKEIKDSYDPKIVEQKENEINANDLEIENIEHELITQKKELSLIEKYAYCKFYTYYMEVVEKNKKNIKNIKDKIETANYKEIKKSNRLNTLEDLLRDNIKQMESTFSETTRLLESILPKEEKNHLKVWKTINLHDVLVDLEFDSQLEKEISHFESILNGIYVEQSEESRTEAEIYSSLIEFLENYKDTNVLIPGLDKSISEFLYILKEANKKNEFILELSTEIRNAKSNLKRLSDYKNEINNILPIIKELVEYSDEGDGNKKTLVSEKDIDCLKDELKKNKGCFNKYAKLLMSIDVDPDQADNIYKQIKDEVGFIYGYYTETQLCNKINDNKEEVTRIENRKENLKKKRNILRQKYDELKSKEPHKYQQYAETLNDLHLISQKLQQKFLVEYDNYINIMVDGNQNKYTIERKNNSDIEQYYKSISKYLAKRVGSIRHIDSAYTLCEVNLLNEQLITTTGKKIRFIDMGTGQSQSAFLLGLLNKNNNKPIIALFDEVAMMDTISMNPIYERFNELYNQGLLLAGVVVQKGDELKVESKVW